eukprot:4408618-Pyramimonas_sp.AAC.1
MQMHPQKKFFLDKLRGTISCNWRQLAQLTPMPDSDAPQIRWAEDNLQLEGMARGQLEDGLN